MICSLVSCCGGWSLARPMSCCLVNIWCCSRPPDWAVPGNPIPMPKEAEDEEGPPAAAAPPWACEPEAGPPITILAPAYPAKSECAIASSFCSCATCLCNNEMAPTHPYTGSLTRASASYAREFTASSRWCWGSSLSSLVMLLAPKILCTLANLWGWSGGKYGANTHSAVHFLLKNLHAAQGELEDDAI